MMTGTLSYEELLQTFTPRPIVTEEEYEATLVEINALMDKSDLTPDEQDFLTLLGTLVMVYEEDHLPDEMFEVRGVELIRGLMELHNLKQKDLITIFKTKSIASEVLSGKRPLTVSHINHLATFFHLPHELFFEPLNQSSV